jgi:hypothetical protein
MTLIERPDRSKGGKMKDFPRFGDGRPGGSFEV